MEPVIPRSWPGFRATRQFRGTTYDIEVVRQTGGSRAGAPGEVATGRVPAVELIVDGRPIEGTTIPLPEAGTRRVQVEVRLA